MRSWPASVSTNSAAWGRRGDWPALVQELGRRPLTRGTLRVSGPERQRAGAARRFVASVSVKGAGGHGIGRAPVQ
jgi:hypothetical protein